MTTPGSSGGALVVAGEPVFIRLPRGYLVLVALAVLVLIVLAYWVGHSRGHRAGVASMTPADPVEPLLAQENPAPPPDFLAVNPGGSGQGPGPAGASTNPASRRGAAAGAGTDPRREGMNYFVLAHYPRSEAQRLSDFLGRGGVETFIAASHNAGLFQVLALEGFSRDEIKSERRTRLEQRLRQLGREWKEQHKGAGDLSDLFLSRYKPAAR